MYNFSHAKKYFWKGKLVNEKTYKLMLQRQSNGFNSRKKVPTDEEKISKENEEMHRVDGEFPVKGERIIDVEFMARNLRCTDCKSPLLLEDIIKETPRGCKSMFNIECHSCLLINSVPTGKRGTDTNDNSHFQLNYKIAMALIHTGIAYECFDKLCACLDIPSMSRHTFEYYERLVGLQVEQVAQESCDKATLIEKELTIKNIDEISKILPKHLDTDFLVSPRLPDDFNGQLPSDYLSQSLVRVMVSFDTGWSKRGSGYNYDSLNGYATFCGTQSGLVVAYGADNRSCKTCKAAKKRKTKPKAHACRVNFCGSAKAMEADLAIKLGAENKIFEKNNVQVGIFVADDDSSAIKGLRGKVSHEVIKLSDRGHANKNVKKLLLNIDKAKDPDKELHNATVTYLHKCFKYAVAQNHGDVEGLAKSIKNIPEHAFNHHEECDAAWCGFLKHGENYRHSVIGDGLQNDVLYRALTDIFKQLADNAEKFAFSASTQVNESMNALISRKAPKAICYSLSAAMDFRVAAAVAEKNEGENYIMYVFDRLGISYSKNTIFHSERNQKTKKRMSEYRQTIEAKRARVESNNDRAALRFRKEKAEGPTYQSSMSLLDAAENNHASSEPVEPENIDLFDSQYSLVFFDLETSDLSKKADILQVAAGKSIFSFNAYIKPSRAIDPRATAVHGLRMVGSDLRLHDEPLEAVSLQTAIKDFITYLAQFNQPTVLIAHNCQFDAIRLLLAAQKVSLMDQLKTVVAGFACSLISYKKKHKNAKFKKGDLTLSELTRRSMQISEERAHDAVYDVHMLKHFACTEFTAEELLVSFSSVDELLLKEEEGQDIKKCLATLSPLKDILTTYMLSKIASARIQLDDMVKSHENDGNEGIQKLLNPAKLREETLQKIYSFFSNYHNS